jgi:alginate O-acetyltransferase complex protein AlgI
MTFIELPFAFLLGTTAALWMLCRGRYGATVAVLLTASLIFYGYERWWLAALLAAYCGVDWFVGIRIARGRSPRTALTIGVAFNLGVLAAWKYTPLLIDIAADLSGVASPAWREPWSVPVGLSFYALTGIAYLVDVYRRELPAETHPGRFALFLSFFPHLMAGPILRGREFLPLLHPATLPDRPAATLAAALLLGRGYFKKLVLADRIAVAIDPFFLHIGTPATAGVWALPYLYLYAFQIYCDFSGYTDIARGLALWFGFRWPDNFHLPYLATSVRDFWQRWHITLSRFLRDYLYIPLGGNRGGVWRSARALMITMVLGGLWHGGQWTFLLWGALHGTYLLAHRAWRTTAVARRLGAQHGIGGRLWQLACVVLTFHAVSLAWSFFRAPTVAGALACLRQCVPQSTTLLAGGSSDVSLWVLLATYCAFALAARRMVVTPFGERIPPFVEGAVAATAVALFALAILLAPGGTPPPFIYFQF